MADIDALNLLWRSGVSAWLRDIGIVDKAAQHRIVACFSQKKAELLGRLKPEQEAGEVQPASA